MLQDLGGSSPSFCRAGSILHSMVSTRQCIVMQPLGTDKLAVASCTPLEDCHVTRGLLHAHLISSLGLEATVEREQAPDCSKVQLSL